MIRCVCNCSYVDVFAGLHIGKETFKIHRVLSKKLVCRPNLASDPIGQLVKQRLCTLCSALSTQSEQPPPMPSCQGRRAQCSQRGAAAASKGPKHSSLWTCFWSVRLEHP